MGNPPPYAWCNRCDYSAAQTSCRRWKNGEYAPWFYYMYGDSPSSVTNASKPVWCTPEGDSVSRYWQDTAYGDCVTSDYEFDFRGCPSEHLNNPNGTNANSSSLSPMMILLIVLVVAVIIGLCMSWGKKNLGQDDQKEQEGPAGQVEEI